ncbi:methionine synthase [Kineococcus sp. T13]|uniref:methionine synthase n=1 Tax=Kineococcus vitellinus TaxID=2696565 RepID=UPI001411B5F0|nr:methionine synthase [Kineococcus vitellinus]NAZ76389.1 methionine synthase [Kineococcus vitellinus]
MATDEQERAAPGGAAGAVTGLGPMPGEDPREAARTVLGELGEAPHVPHLAQLPARGPGADPVGRTAALLVDLPVDLQPAGWRFVDAPGRDARRAASFLRADLDELAEAAAGWSGPLALAVVGPWSLLAAVELARGERSVSDPGARRDVVASLAEGIRAHVADVRRLVPGAQVLVQVEEPSVPAVLAGRLPTQSGYGTLRAVPQAEVRDGLRAVLDAVRAAGARPVVRLAAEEPPLALVREVGADAVALDVRGLGALGWESLAATVEAGVRVWAGVLPVLADPPSVPALVDVLRVPWRRVGLPAALLADVVLTPVEGLQALDPAAVRPLLGRLREAGAAVAESSGD